MQSNESSGRKAPPVFAAFWQECSRPASILKTTVEEWARTLCPDVPVLSRHSPSCVRTFPAPYETSRFCVGLPGPVRTFSISGRTFLTSCEPSLSPGGPSPPCPCRRDILVTPAWAGSWERQDARNADIFVRPASFGSHECRDSSGDDNFCHVGRGLGRWESGRSRHGGGSGGAGVAGSGWSRCGRDQA